MTRAPAAAQDDKASPLSTCHQTTSRLTLACLFALVRLAVSRALPDQHMDRDPAL